MFTATLWKYCTPLAALALLFAVLGMLLPGVSAAPLRTSPVAIRVSTSADDAEEMASGSVDLDDGDLELVHDYSAVSLQTVGVRFNLVDIPQGATITSAYVQFMADEANDATITIAIHGEDIDNATIFTSANYDITDRTYTTASVNWQPGEWIKTEEGEDQQTADISTIIQEIVNRGGWEEDNSLVVIFDGTDDKRRVAESYDSVPAGAPELNVTYTTGATPTPTSTPSSTPEPTATPSATPSSDTFLSLSDTPGEYSGAYHLMAINSEADGLVEVPDIGATGSGLFSGGLIWSGSYIQSNSYIQGGTGIEATTGNVEAVTGDVIAGGDVTAGDDILATDDVTAGGDVIVGSDLVAAGGGIYASTATIANAVEADDLVLTGDLTVNGLVLGDLYLYPGNLTADNIHSYGSTTSVLGISTLMGDVSAAFDLNAGGDVNVGDDIIIDDQLVVYGTTMFFDNVVGDTTFTGDVAIGGDADVGGEMIVGNQGSGDVVMALDGYLFARYNIHADGTLQGRTLHVNQDVQAEGDILAGWHREGAVGAFYAGYMTEAENYTGQTIHTRSLIALDNNMGGTFFYANDNVTDGSIKLFDSDDVGGPKWAMSFRYICAENGDEAATVSQGNLLLVPGRTEYICNLGRTGEYVEIRWWVPSSGGEMRMEASPGETFRVVLDAIWLND